MPRPRDPNNEGSRRRTEVWREGRLRRGRPESSTIDRAIAASVAAFYRVDFEAEGQTAHIDMIVAGAERILLSKGFDRFQIRSELEGRLTRRQDLVQLGVICGVVKACSREGSRSEP